MNDEIIIEPFEAKFEDLEIHVHKAKIEIMKQVNNEAFDKPPAYTTIWEDILPYHVNDEKSLVGRLFIMFRNQGNDFDLALWLEVKLVVRAPATSEMAAIVCKLVQFLFKWMNDYNYNNEIKDKNGERFIVPDFLYSTSHFKPHFPD
jgi:hypothetical protein